jgi:hypothetical protein
VSTVLTPDQRRTAEAIVSVFETGHLPVVEAYSTCTILADGAGLSFGVHQATGATLEEVVALYGIRAGAYAAPIRRALAGHQIREAATWSSLAAAPQWVRDTADQLRLAGADSVMRSVQDEVFERFYWDPSAAQADRLGLQTALGVLAVYDLAIQSGLGRLDVLRTRFPERPPCSGGEERAWVSELLAARGAWLAGLGGVAARTTYRVDALLELAEEGRWDLARPLTVRGVRIA